MPLVVVSDCSPIRALHHLGLLSVCQGLYGSVIVPEAVCEELRRPTAACPAIQIDDHAGFEVRPVSRSPADLGVSFDLDPGETEAIALALELNADLVLMDERKGTHVARRLGLGTIGVVGVLLESKHRGLIDQVLPCVDRLVAELRFFVSPTLRRRLVQLTGE